MNRKQVELGMQVVLNGDPDATVFFVEEISNRIVKLVEIDKNNRKIGKPYHCDCAALQLPSLGQLGVI